jgi:hypothetical protein
MGAFFERLRSIIQFFKTLVDHNQFVLVDRKILQELTEHEP